MELRQLVYFDAVVRYGGFSRAAERLHIAQPAVSAQIRRLETELGTTLLQRTTRRVALTHAGELFLARTRRVLDQLDRARADLDELSTVRRGQVRVGATQILGSLDLPAALAQFRRRYPGVSLALQTGLIAELLDTLNAGEVDLVLGPVHDDLPDRYLAHPLVIETLVLVTAPGHPLATVNAAEAAASAAGGAASGMEGAAGARASLAAVRDEPFVCLPADSRLHGILVEAAAAEGFTPRIEFETYSPASMRELVAAGLGVALIAGSATDAPGPPVAVYQLDPAPWHPPIGLIRQRDRPLTPAAEAFGAHIARIAAAAALSQLRC
jgi:LysR family transcriptional regulator, transcription activator of glutamate synthase operon